MNIVLLTSHAIAEYDDLRMFTDLGYSVFSIGGAYSETPFEGKRPALPNAARYPDLEAACNRTREAHLDPPGDRIDWAKADLADDIIDWADVIIVHHFPERWIRDQWSRISQKDVIWRTCGQSDPRLETVMAPLHRQGMQIVRYSPKEREYFDSLGVFAGEDAVIRFGKYPGDYGPWVGDDLRVGNITQHLAQRGDSCGYDFWLQATDGAPWPGVPSTIPTGSALPVAPAGPGSEVLRGGVGSLDYESMLTYLRWIRCYLYTGTVPASYTLGLMEAMLSGVPIISIGAQAWHGPTELFEVPDILPQTETSKRWDGPQGRPAQNDPGQANRLLNDLLTHPDEAAEQSAEIRQRAIELFDVATVGRQWVDFLGAP